MPLKYWTEYVTSPECCRDTRIICKDGAVAWNGLFFVPWSPLIKSHFAAVNPCEECGVNLVIMLPDFDLKTVKLMLSWCGTGEVSFTGDAAQASALESLLYNFGVDVELHKSTRTAQSSTCSNCGEEDERSGHDGVSVHQEFCQTSFNFLQVGGTSRKNIRKRVSEKQGRKRREKVPRPIKAKRSVRDGPYKLADPNCRMCSLGYKDLVVLRRHLASRHHLGELLFAHGFKGPSGEVTMCGICGKDYSTYAEPALIRPDLAKHIGCVHDKLEEIVPPMVKWQLEKLRGRVAFLR